MKVLINSERSLQYAKSLIENDYHRHKYLSLNIKYGKDRSLDQNTLWAALYKNIADFYGHETFIDVRSRCKLMYGVPIMKRDCKDFASKWDQYFSLANYEEMLLLMGPNKFFGPDGFPVTRLFTRQQGVEYTNLILDNHHCEHPNLNAEVQNMRKQRRKIQSSV